MIRSLRLSPRGVVAYSQVFRQLHEASIPVKELKGNGYVAVTPVAGRVAAMAFLEDGPNLFWSNPQLNDAALVKVTPEKLLGGLGGDRLWFSPELDYYWDGVPDWKNHSNYKIPAVTDPGNYQFVGANAGSLELRADGRLSMLGTSHTIGFEVKRVIRMVPPPSSVRDSLMSVIDYVGIESSHTLMLGRNAKFGKIALWHLLQMPVGSILLVPLNKNAKSDDKKPLSYGLPGGWIENSEYILWQYGGEANAKFGLPAAALTGRTAVLRELHPNYWCMIVRQFPAHPNALYGDHPYHIPRDDQVFQAWDGYGFGEMEYHSPVLDARQSARELNETDQLWAFGGSPQQMLEIAGELLEIHIDDLFTSERDA